MLPGHIAFWCSLISSKAKNSPIIIPFSSYLIIGVKSADKHLGQTIGVAAIFAHTGQPIIDKRDPYPAGCGCIGNVPSNSKLHLLHL